MFCDLIGSTELSVCLDPEDLRRVFERYRETVAAAVVTYGGRIAGYLGDGIIVYFGFPQAHEDDAVRAVHSALLIVKSVTEQLTVNEVPLKLRVGIATGIVVVGSLRGRETASELEGVVGETPNLAARLQAHAEPNGIVVEQTTHQLIGNTFDYRDLGEIELKGFPRVVRAWQVIGIGSVQSRLEALRGTGRTPLVGREGELNFLERRWQQAKNGTGQVVLFSGEPGIGKSRIVEAICENVRAERALTQRYYCSPYHSDSPLYPFIVQFEREAGLDRSQSPDQKLANLQAVIQQAGLDVTATLPLFAEMLSVRKDLSFVGGNFSAHKRRTQTLAALRDRLRHLADRQPTLVLFEDVHWIDPTSHELIESVIKTINRLPILMIITYRPEFKSSWGGLPNVSSISINRLNRDQTIAMINSLVIGEPFSIDVVNQIVDRAEGVPLYIEELTKTIAEERLFAKTGELHQVNGALAALQIPAALQGSLVARLDRLLPAKQIAQVGSVIGREFSYELIKSVSKLTDDALLQALNQLETAELIFRRGITPQCTYSFKHALIQEAAYDGLLKSERRALHAELTTVMETQLPEICNAQPEVVAHHYTRAELYDTAATYWKRAAKRALERSANMEVIGHARKGLATLHRLPHSLERSERELELIIFLGAAYRATKGFASLEVENAFLQAREICQSLDRKWEFLDVLRGLASCYYIRGDLRSHRLISTQAISVGQQKQDTNYLMMGHYMAGSRIFWEGDFNLARQELELATSLRGLTDVSRDTLSSQIDPNAFTLIHLSWTLWITGYPDQALQVSDRTIKMARELAQPFTLAMALMWAVWVRICVDETIVNDEILTELRGLTVEHHFTYIEACATHLEGWAHSRRGDFATGLDLMCRGIADLRQQAAGLGRPWLLALPAKLYAEINEPQKGLVFISEALAHVESTGERHWQAELYRLKGELMLIGDEKGRNTAEQCFQQAIETARHQGARTLELRAVLSMVRMLRSRGELRSAHTILANTVSWFTEGFQTLDLRHARVQLAELSEALS
jgi:class 3 adenylate cyclase